MAEIYKQLPCKHCGTLVRVHSRSKWASCPECKAEWSREYQRERYARNQWMAEYKRNVRVVHDPLPMEDGGFSEGAIFTWQEYKQMVKDGTFTPGTKLLVKERPVTLRRIDGQLVPIGG